MQHAIFRKFQFPHLILNHWKNSSPSGKPCFSYFAHQRWQPLHISINHTPNEESRVFSPEGIPSYPVSAPADPLWFPNAKSSEGVSPLADKLFQIDGVSKIMINKMSLTITKRPDVPWTAVQPTIILTLNKCLSNGVRFQVIEERSLPEEDSHDDAYDFVEKSVVEDDDHDDIESCIKEVLLKRVAPMVEADGGQIKLKKFDSENGIVWIELLGACDGCPSSTITVKGHIETVLKYFFDEVVEVRLWTEEIENRITSQREEHQSEPIANKE